MGGLTEPAASKRSDDDLGTGGRTAAGQEDRGGGFGEETVGGPVRDVARRKRLRRHASGEGHPLRPAAPGSKRGLAPLSPPRVYDSGLTVASYVAAQFVSEAFGRVGPSC